MDSETRALARTGVVLLVVSLGRWAWATGSTTPVLGLPADVTALADSSRVAAAEEAERSRPLGEGERIDPNLASTAQLDRLPGVGPATAQEIIDERARAGPFGSVDDLLRVRGLGPATLERLRVHVRVSPIRGGPRSGRHDRPRAPVRLDLNAASEAELVGLPGIGPALAARIVEARGQRAFASVDDLARVRGIGPATVDRLRARVRAGRRP